jgi:hypothetical protein
MHRYGNSNYSSNNNNEIFQPSMSETLYFMIGIIMGIVLLILYINDYYARKKEKEKEKEKK